MIVADAILIITDGQETWKAIITMTVVAVVVRIIWVDQGILYEVRAGY